MEKHEENNTEQVSSYNSGQRSALTYAYGFSVRRKLMKSQVFLVTIALLTGCTQPEVQDVSHDKNRVEGYSVGIEYELQTDLFVYGLYDKPLSYYDEQGHILWLLRLTPPIGEMNGYVPDSFESWIEDKEKYKSIYGIALAGTLLIVERIEEVFTIKDHLTQVLARIKNGEFSGMLVELSLASNTSDDYLKVSIDEEIIKRFEPGSPYNSGQSLRD